MTDGDDTRTYSSRTWALAVGAPAFAAALAAGAIFLVPSLSDDPARPAPHAAVADGPLDLATVKPETAAHYTFAAAHEHEFSQIPCYCGCEEFLDHRNLYDCFVRPDGGWEAHGSGCGVCLGEAVTARRLLEAGQPPAAVRDAVIAQFSSTPATAPPAAG